MSPALRGTFRAGKMYAFAGPALPQSACKVPLHKPCGNLPAPTAASPFAVTGRSQARAPTVGDEALCDPHAGLV
jgi:hypothetical protein